MPRDERSAVKPLLPDRDAITTKAWSEAYELSIRPPPGDEEGERVLWPRGVCTYSRPIDRPLVISDTAPFPLNRQLRVRRSQGALEGDRLQTSPLELGFSGVNGTVGVDSHDISGSLRTW